MKQITADIPDDMCVKIDDAIACSIAENEGDMIRKALRFFLGGE